MTKRTYSLFAWLMALPLVACGSQTSASPSSDSASPSSDYTFYWISHGSAADPYWVAALEGANTAATHLGVTVQSSFSDGDLAAQKEAFGAAIAAGADGIAFSSLEKGSLDEEVASAISAGIPVVTFSDDDPESGRLAFVGTGLFEAGHAWASYLVENDLVQEGDSVWMPVEIPGANYQVEETEAIASVFDPLGITFEVFDATFDPAESLANMTTYLTANASDVDAIIGLGDLVMTNIQPSFDEAGIEPGQIPVVGWGSTNETAQAVKAGYVNAAVWGYPDASGYDPIVMLMKTKSGLSIGYDVVTIALYDASNADFYIDLTAE